MKISDKELLYGLALQRELELIQTKFEVFNNMLSLRYDLEPGDNVNFPTGEIIKKPIEEKPE